MRLTRMRSVLHARHRCPPPLPLIEMTCFVDADAGIALPTASQQKRGASETITQEERARRRERGKVRRESRRVRRAKRSTLQRETGAEKRGGTQQACTKAERRGKKHRIGGDRPGEKIDGLSD